jgi:hypothetical protein
LMLRRQRRSGNAQMQPTRREQEGAFEAPALAPTPVLLWVTSLGAFATQSRPLSSRYDVARDDQSVTRALETSHVKLRMARPTGFEPVVSAFGGSEGRGQ